MVEFALGFPLVMLAVFFGFAALDAVATAVSAEAGATRAASVLAGTNDEELARQAATEVGWLQGQAVTLLIAPGSPGCRPAGTLATLTLRPAGHLAFLLPTGIALPAVERAVLIESSVDAPCSP